MFPKQLDQNPADDRAAERERSEWQGYRSGPVRQRSARP